MQLLLGYIGLLNAVLLAPALPILVSVAVCNAFLKHQVVCYTVLAK